MSEIEIVNAKEGSELNEENTVRCLDQGFVRLVESMGDDSSIVQAARVSYGKGTVNVRRDKALINYLMKHRHNSPFEMVEFKFHCRMPIFVARQWVRHRTANINELSGRYSVMEDSCWTASKDDLRQQSEVNRQGSFGAVSEPEGLQILETLRTDQELLFRHYREYIEKGVAREIARTNLPLSTYTEWYWKIDLHNLLHFLELRMDAHAQKEIREYANAIAGFVKRICPLTWEAFEEHRIRSVTFSGSEMQLLRSAIRENWLLDQMTEMRINQLKEQDIPDTSMKVEIAELREKLTGEPAELQPKNPCCSPK
jgi:thymidylate synthase (FAD)